MTERTTTSNGHEIVNEAPVLDAAEFHERMGETYGLTGRTPAERMGQLQALSNEGIAILLEDINKSVQGSADSLMSHERTITIGDKQTIPLEDRYAVFTRLIDDIKSSPEATSPERKADVLALGVVLLHPFHDGNGRTARTVGLLFRESYDSDDYEADYTTVIEPRDDARARGGFLINGYTPRFPENFDQSNANQVSTYLHDLLYEEQEGVYTSCYGQAPLHTA